MSGPGIELETLPLNFPHDFLPERRLLARLLPFAAAKGRGTKVEIGAETGIPTGESTGKVEPMIHYARGMGLIRVAKDGGRWQLSLTPLGRLVAEEDPYLSESVTLWILHLLLCRRYGLAQPATGVADVWFALFAEGGLRLGNRFDQASYLAFLTERHGVKGYLRGLASLVLRSYLEPTCFGSISVLSAETLTDQTLYLRRSAPVERSHFPAFAAYLFLVWDALYPNHHQLAIGEFFEQSRCLTLLGWDSETASQWLYWMTDHGLLQLDRQTGGALALRLQDTETVIAGLFDELI
ncbi:MAG TPA: hypothetical protein P5260_12275 [Candidatus Competibacter sp.]|jgi:hypothetical protein|nr:hypothetical protein [Candidatus Competibacter sp.]